jgi:hypothetical protein
MIGKRSNGTKVIPRVYIIIIIIIIIIVITDNNISRLNQD